MKKGKEIVVRIKDQVELDPYLEDVITNTRIIVLNAYEKFWGPVEIVDTLVRRMLDEPEFSNKVAFITCDKNLCPQDFFGKHSFTSKPSYFFIIRGQIVDSMEGLDMPQLTEKLTKAISQL